MSYRQTFVIEYASPDQAPSVGAGMQMLGGNLIAVQFDDALEENEALIECISLEDADDAGKLREKMKAERPKFEALAGEPESACPDKPESHIAADYLPSIPRTLGAFATAFYVSHKRPPNNREIWDAARLALVHTPSYAVYRDGASIGITKEIADLRASITATCEELGVSPSDTKRLLGDHLFNGLTEQETSASASVSGLTDKKA